MQHDLENLFLIQGPHTTREERTEAKYAETSGYIVPAKGQKPTNPKQPIGSNKIPYHLWPFIASAYGSLGMLDGTLKYGRSNFRASGVKASIYIDACLRHLVAWFEGEENASDSGVSHLGHALACIAIILDARAAGNFTDDRMYPGGYLSAVEELERVVATLRQRHADKTPHHFTIQDIGQTLASDPKEQV